MHKRSQKYYTGLSFEPLTNLAQLRSDGFDLGLIQSRFMMLPVHLFKTVKVYLLETRRKLSLKVTLTTLATLVTPLTINFDL